MPFNTGQALGTKQNLNGREYILTNTGWRELAPLSQKWLWVGRVNLTDDTWNGFDQNFGPSDATIDRNYGTGATPNPARNMTGWMMPYNGTITNLKIIGRFSNGENNSGLIQVVAQRKQDDNNAHTDILLGDQKAWAGTSTRNRIFDFDLTSDTQARAFEAGDIVAPLFYRTIAGL